MATVGQRINSTGVVRKSLSTQTLDQLLGWLKKGTFKPGSKLPSQNELVERFGVSRTGIREALQMMAVLNLIDIRPGMGCFVKRVSTEYIIHAESPEEELSQLAIQSLEGYFRSHPQPSERLAQANSLIVEEGWQDRKAQKPFRVEYEVRNGKFVK